MLKNPVSAHKNDRVVNDANRVPCPKRRGKGGPRQLAQILLHTSSGTERFQQHSCKTKYQGGNDIQIHVPVFLPVLLACNRFLPLSPSYTVVIDVDIPKSELCQFSGTLNRSTNRGRRISKRTDSALRAIPYTSGFVFESNFDTCA